VLISLSGADSTESENPPNTRPLSLSLLRLLARAPPLSLSLSLSCPLTNRSLISLELWGPYSMAQPGSGAAETSGNAFSIASLTSLPRRMHPLPRKVMRSPKHSSVIHPTSGAGAGGSPLPPVMKKTGSMSQLMRYRSLNSGDSDSDTEDSSSTVDSSDLIAAEALSREISSDEATAATAAAAATAIPTTSSDTSNSIPTIVTSSTSSSSNPTISVSASCPPQGALLSSSSSSGSPARLRSLPAGRRVLALDAISLSQRQLPRVSFSFGEYVPGDDLLTGELLMPLSSRDSNTTDDVVIDIMMAPDGPAASSSAAAATASGSSETAATSAAAASSSSSKQTPEQIAYRNRQRRRTIAELIQTEADYIKDLQILIQQIMLPMGRKRDFLTDTPLVSPEQMQTIFSNITTLPAVNIELLDRFEQACESTDLVAELANWLPSTAARQAFMSPITSPITSPRGSPTRVRSPRTSPRTSPSHAAQLSASLEVLAAKENCADRSPSSDSSPSKSASSSSDNTASSSIADAATLIVAADASPAAAAGAATSATDGTLEGLIAFDHQSPIMIGKIFLDLADYFKMYTQYCANQVRYQLTRALTLQRRFSINSYARVMMVLDRVAYTAQVYAFSRGVVCQHAVRSLPLCMSRCLARADYTQRVPLTSSLILGHRNVVMSSRNAETWISRPLSSSLYSACVNIHCSCEYANTCSISISMCSCVQALSFVRSVI